MDCRPDIPLLAYRVADGRHPLFGGLAIAQVGYDTYLRFMWPLVALFVVSAAVLGIAAGVAQP